MADTITRFFDHARNFLCTGCLAFFFVFAFAWPQIALSQTQPSKADVELILQRMTPEEAERKLKELGITKEEAIRRAKELGVNVEDYLSRAATGLQSGGLLQEQPQIATQKLGKSIRDSLVRVQAMAMKKLVEVPGFKGRRGIDSTIQPFGYEIFQLSESLFEPSMYVSTPASYLLGPGDELTISVWGETKLNYQLTVNRDGNLVVPEVGPVSANGQTIQQFREKLLRRMTNIYSGLRNGAPTANTFLDVSLGKLKTIQVYVLGEVARPGGYVVSSMSTVFHALYLAGGPTANGTMREIQISRDDKAASSVDLYDYIVRGDKSKDIRLQDGDVVFVKPAVKRVAVVGRVLRPAIYETKEKETLADLLSICGGLLFDSYFDRLHVERVIPFEQRKFYSKNILDIDLEFSSLKDLKKSSYVLEDGDIVTVQKISDQPFNRVTITGNVNKPGAYQWRDGMTVKDVIMLADSLQRNTFSERGTLFRTLPNLRKEILAFNPRLALAGDQENNLPLKNEDSLVVYKESQFFPEHTVTIGGAVRKPGAYVRNEKMTPGDLAVLAGGLKEEGLTKGWQISRLDTSKLGVYARIYTMDMPAEYWRSHTSEPFYLQDFDHVFVPSDPKFSEPKVVQVSGYAMYPGPYIIQNERERLSDILRRAGGAKPGAYLEASTLIRKQNNAGLIPIDFKKALDDPSSRDNVEVQNGDSVYIAFHDDVVYVRGEVFVPSAVLYKKGASLSYYLKQAGGVREEGDEGKTVVFLPGGKKWESSWFADPDILPGSSILVPRKIEKEDKTLPVLRDLATILASLAAITVALVQVTK